MCKPRSDWERCIIFHGHECPGLAIGYKVSQAAKEKLLFAFSPDEDIVCVTENDACGVDAVQVLTGCSLGKGNLIYRDTGKQAFSFFNRTNGKKIRIVFRNNVMDGNEDWEKLQTFILNAPPDELFDFKEPFFEAPSNAQILTSIVCEGCGESAPEPKIRLQEGKRLCLDCYQGYSRGW
jgi:formylmethanofuran dehydrogenase subunit E